MLPLHPAGEEDSNPVELITAALAAGAAARLAGVASQAMADEYNGLKAALAARFPPLGVHIQAVELRPDSHVAQSSLAETLTKVGAQRDTELVQVAKVLLERIEREAPEAALRAGVNLGQATSDRSGEAGPRPPREGGPAGERLRQFEESRAPRRPKAQPDQDSNEDLEAD